MNTVCLLASMGLGLLLGASNVPAADVPRPEHPRPDRFRGAWLNLNGEWQFEIDGKGDGEARGLATGKDLGSRIVVPFCPESKLSGIGHYDIMKNVWYRRFFELPDAMKGKRILLHFGGVDYRTRVWVNGKAVGSHTGGDTQFSFEITRFLKDGANEIVVHAFDDTRSGLQPTGKQTHNVSEGCVYTRTTGIWQTVWLEAVGSTWIGDVQVIPDPDRARVLVDVAVNGRDKGLELVAEAFADGKKTGEDACPASWRGHRLVIDLKKKILWEPGKPFLYDLKLALKKGARTVDEVQSYFGLRSVSIEGRAILINGKRVFQRLILDQGFYPDGVWTAPSDAELKADIERSMASGYNGARLHQKVFEPRFLYWADQLGYLVWGEFPNWGYNYKPEGYAPYIDEWVEILLRDRNHPSIVGWCPFNETPGSAGELQRTILNLTRSLDPTRPVLETSGWSHTAPDPEVLDAHDYDQNPESFRSRWLSYFGAPSSALAKPARYGGGAARRQSDRGLPFMVSEFGGTRWGDSEKDGWGYGKGPQNLEEFYQRYDGLVGALLDNPYMFGFCYTQLTDVEQEHNGLYFYDRRPKFDLKRLHAITSREAAYEKSGPPETPPAPPRENKWRVLTGAAPDGELCKPYRYTTAKPADGWEKEAFDDGAWKQDLPPFGNALEGVRTKWTTPDIWLRRTFEWDGSDFKTAALVTFHDEDTEFYVNGVKIKSVTGFVTGYQIYALDDKLRKALKKGANTLSIHTHQSAGGQYIDAAILVE